MALSEEQQNFMAWAEEQDEIIHTLHQGSRQPAGEESDPILAHPLMATDRPSEGLRTRRTAMETYTGVNIDFADLKAEQIKLWDIAQALSLTCRFGGHIPRFYSVAEHALMVHDLVKERMTERFGGIEIKDSQILLAALHHDSHEAYIGDSPKPLKNAAGEQLDALALEIDSALAEAFGIEPSLFDLPAIKEADELALRIEAWHLKPSHGIGNPGGGWIWNEPPPTMKELPLTAPAAAAQDFINAHISAGGRVT